MKKMICTIALLLAVRASAVTLEQNLSREDPKFDCAAATMAVGRDGKVYLSSTSSPGYILRLSRDGHDKLGGDAIYAMQNATANAAGLIASANAHFNHSINIYDPQFHPVATCNEFLVNDIVQWDAPGDVEAGAGGDFYGLDQHRNRIVRVNTSGKVVQVYTLPHVAATARPAWKFRVCESKQVFDVMSYDGNLRCIGFDGQVQWEQRPGAIPFTVDDDGVVYLMTPTGTAVRRIGLDGKPLPHIQLHMGDLAPTGTSAITGVAVFGKDLVIKRADSTELFQVYDLGSGHRKAVVSTNHEKFTAELPGLIWTAGQAVPLKIGLESSPAVERAAPDWRVWATPFGDSDWRELKLDHGQVTVPADWAGLYQIKIAPTTNPAGPSEYLLQEMVEVRAPDSRGTVSVWTPHNRIWFGQGEEVRVSVLLRTRDAGKPQDVRVQLRRDRKMLWSTVLSLQANATAHCTLPGTFTRQLIPGRYEVTAAPLAIAVASTTPAKGASLLLPYTFIRQPLRIGPGMASASPFRVVLYGDYTGFYSAATVWDFADTADQMLEKTRALGINQYVNRTGYYPLDFANNDTGRPLLREFARRLSTDPGGAAPDKVDFGFPQEHALGAYGANAIREMTLLVGMDGGLPVGTGYDKRKPEQFAENIQRYTLSLGALPAFYGWTWAANWWADPNLAFHSPQEKAAYDKALQHANETGAWDKILDKVGDERINWQVEAQAMFEKDLRATGSRAVTAASGPYRRPEVYPPVSFANVDEVDLHYQAEQITTPDWTPHAVDYYQRPGKPTWTHPELLNDSGTGEEALTMLWMPIMRGVTGIGNSGNIPNWGALPTDSRSGYGGTASVFMAINGFARRYGPWLTTLQNDDRVAILVSHREVKVDGWGGIGGLYFTRLWEAYQACLLAHYPATFLYPEDVTPQTWSQFKALLVVDQRYEIDPELADLIAQAKKHGVAILADETCRESLVKDFTRLPVSFDHIEKLAGFNVDWAYWSYPEALLADAPAVARVLATICPPVATIDQPQVLVSQRRSADARIFWVVNNTYPSLYPGLLWRVGNGVSTRMPVIAHVTLPVEQGQAVYDVFTQQLVQPDIHADLRYTQARLYVVVPREIKKLKLEVGSKPKPGEELKWSASVEGIDAAIPIHLRMLGADGAVVEERFATTGQGVMTVPVNAAEPVTLEATELISGKSSRWPALGSFEKRADDQEPKAADSFGPHLRDVAVSRDGGTVLLNAFDWGNNLYALDPASGKVRWQKRVGHHFAYAPASAGDGFVVQGYDFNTGEGYHLYQLDAGGQATRRFTLVGLPARLTNWAFSPILNDHINNFAAAADGSWVASAGDLGLAVWSRDGRLLWSQDWSKTTRETRCLLALDDRTLVVAKGIEVAAYESATGRLLWNITLATTGEVLGLTGSADGKTIAARTSTQSGRVYVVRSGASGGSGAAGTVVGMLPTAADQAVPTPDGAHVVVTTGNQLKCYAADGGLQWLFNADSPIRFVRVTADGTRVAATTEMGELTVLNATGRLLYEKNLSVLAAPAWLPDDGLLLATWMGDVSRLDSKYHERWRVKLSGDSSDVPSAGVVAVPDKTPTTRLTSWSNAEAAPWPLTPNLIDPKAVLVHTMLGDREAVLQADTLFDGKTDPPAEPWIGWPGVGLIDSGWWGSFSLEIDTFRTQLRVTAITFVEDAAHPESWMRDARLEYWDAAHEKWIFAQYLTSDAAVHTHKLGKPIEAAKFRITRPDGPGWPQSNLRFAEVVFHGDRLGPSHPDAIANNPVAVLFDERESDLLSLMSAGGGSFQHGGAYSGGTCVRVEPDRLISPGFQTPFGHTVPNWDFDIVEKPEKPGQYRWLQFAYKAANPGTRGLCVRVGPEWPSGGVVADVGEPFRLSEGYWVRKKVGDEPTVEWRVARLDLWAAAKKEFRIRCIDFAAVAGRADFDQVLLARTEADLPAPKVEEKKDILDSNRPSLDDSP